MNINLTTILFIQLMIFTTLVIYNPYEDINYEKINVYEIEEDMCVKDCANVTYADTDQTDEEIEDEVKEFYR